MPHLVVLAICATMIARAQVRYGSMPTDWADWSHVATKGHGRNSSLGGLVGQVANTAMPEGGPQAFECYTYDDHPTGTTRLTFGCISNVEIAGAGHTREVRGGGVLSGSGRVDRWIMNHNSVNVLPQATGSIGQVCALCPTFPQRGVNERLGVWIDDPAAKHYLAGDARVDRLSFSNGWSLRVNGDTIELWNSSRRVQTFR